MATGCRKCGGGASADHGVMTHSSALTLGADGLFEIFADAGVVPYHGQYLSADVWLVAAGKPEQRFFIRAHRQQARGYYRELTKAGRTTIDHVLARNCPHDLMVELLGA